jgi:hypothetical protein
VPGVMDKSEVIAANLLPVIEKLARMSLSR